MDEFLRVLHEKQVSGLVDFTANSAGPFNTLRVQVASHQQIASVQELPKQQSKLAHSIVIEVYNRGFRV